MYLRLKNGKYLMPYCCILAIITEYYEFAKTNLKKE